MSKTTERTPFWGVRSLPELKYLQLVLNSKITNVTLTRPCFRKLLKIIVDALISATTAEETNLYIIFQALSAEFELSPLHLTKAYSSLSKLFHLSIRQYSVKQDVVKQDLKDFLNFPIDFVNDFASALYSHLRDDIEHSLVNFNRPRFPAVAATAWRVDVSISTSSLSRSLQPVIVLQLRLSDRRVTSFEMSLNSFNILRFNVALVLKEIEELLNRPTLKLAD